MTVENVREERAKARVLRRRVIFHRKRGQPSGKLERAYLRAKARLARAVRAARRDRGRVYSRAEWGAAKPRGAYLPRGSFRFLVRHHTADPAASVRTVAEECAYMRRIQQGHFNRGFIDIGYARVIFPSGRVYEGRPTTALGAHVQGENSGTYGVALAGNFEHEHPTRAAITAFRTFCGGLEARDHRELNPTACPGRNLWKPFPL